MAGRAIEIEGVSKRYELGERSEPYRTIREAITSALRRGGGSRKRAELWALRDVDLAIEEGDVIGVIGRNGAGKSTLLKVVCRITEPTAGVARTHGRVGALLEVGTGFHPELTGREKVFLNGAILGMSRRDITRRFDEIVSFSGVERFLDTPLKRYSSGMYLRLAFAVAAHLEPDILVVDEVLAVGDAEFQEKCLGRMSELRGEGRTVVFVSHDLGAIGRLCDRAVWLEEGRVRADGRVRPVLDSYLRSVAQPASRVDFAAEPDDPVQLLSVSVTDEEGAARDLLRRDEPLAFHVEFLARTGIPGLDVGVRLLNREGLTVLDEVWSDTRAPGERADGPGRYTVTMTVPPVLSPGDYIAYVWIGVWIGAEDYETFVDREALTFRLWPSPDDGREAVVRRRLVQPDVSWDAASDLVPGRRS